MKFTESISDEAVLEELGNRIARYRLNRNMSQDELAREGGISKRTLHRIEHGRSTQASNLIRVLRALQLLQNLEALVPEPAISPMQRLRMKGKMRRRASSRADRTEPAAPWSWGDEE